MWSTHRSPPRPSKIARKGSVACLSSVRLRSGCNEVDLPFNSYDLTRLNGFDVREAGGYVRQQIFQTVGFRAENDDPDSSASQVLLVFDAAVYGEENVIFGRFGYREQVAILESC